MNLKTTYIKIKIERKIMTIKIHTIAIIKKTKDGIWLNILFSVQMFQVIERFYTPWSRYVARYEMK